MPEVKKFDREFRLNKGRIVCASGSDANSSLTSIGLEKSGGAISRYDGVEPFRGKSGSVSFRGLVEESKLVSAPFQEDKGSLLWVLAPLSTVFVEMKKPDRAFLKAGCAVQFVFEMTLEKRQSSCWPLVPIIFEVYRLYQLTRATQYIQHFLLLMKEMFERGGALIGMIAFGH
ncbi:hypothetical protein V6N12_047090 [Hibiscus sabdariffa]|uniref:Uncharacterized protein n=1 Tax=Hibiscus sabdariffa TaxID=183260 RepID=A0ABR1ZNJ6_9ROSI